MVLVGNKPYKTRVFERDEMMTRKSYEMMAKVIRRHRLDDNGTGSGMLASVTDSLVCIFEADNSRFNRARFFTACGMDEDGQEWVI